MRFTGSIRSRLWLPLLLGAIACASRSGLGAEPTAIPQAAQAVRKADAVWAEAAGTGNADAWLAFYAPDAIVFLPGGPLVSGKPHAAPQVRRLLSLPHLGLSWHALQVEIAAGGDLAYVLAAYDLQFQEASGRRAAHHGRRVELWRHEADGTWRCIVDTWSAEDLGASAALPPTTSPAPPAQPALPAAPAAPAAPGPPPAARAADPKYGPEPVHYEEAIRRYLGEHLAQADSIRYRNISAPEQGYVTGISGRFLMRETRTYGWLVRATIEATASGADHGTIETYTFLFRGEKIATVRMSLPTPAR